MIVKFEGIAKALTEDQWRLLGLTEKRTRVPAKYEIRTSIGGRYQVIGPNKLVTEGRTPALALKTARA